MRRKPRAWKSPTSSPPTTSTRASGAPIRAAMTTNLLDLDPAGLASFFAALGEKPFRARQVSHWVHQRFAADVAAMSDLGKALRERLAHDVAIVAPAIVSDRTAADGTRKWLVDV